jgi:hypothetical protein
MDRVRHGWRRGIALRFAEARYAVAVLDINGAAAQSIAGRLALEAQPLALVVDVAEP